MLYGYSEVFLGIYGLVMIFYDMRLSRFLLFLCNMNLIVFDSVKEYVNVLRFNWGWCVLNLVLKLISLFGYFGINVYIVVVLDEWCKYLGIIDMEFLWYRLEFN